MKTYQTLVLDTSSILNQPSIFTILSNTRFIIPIEVLEELDGAKTKQDAVGFNARRANKILDKFRKDSDLSEEFSIDNNNSIIISFEADLSSIPSSYSQNFDAKIIATAKKYSDIYNNLSLISSDISMRIKAAAIGIDAKSEDDVLFGDDEEFGRSEVETLLFLQDEMDDFYRNGFVHTDEKLSQNEPLVIKSIEGSSALGIYRNGRVNKLKVADKKDFNILSISPKNKEQRFAMEMLLDTSIPMVSICGVAGSGKTMLAIAAAMHMLDKGMYERIVLTRPVVSLSTNIGMLPGEKHEKMKPWVQPIFDNIKWALKGGDMYINLLMEKGKIEIESLSYIRGRTFPKTIFIVDECQNTTISEIKAVITRMGTDSKLILTGDVEQIDSPKLDVFNSGLSTVINKFKFSELAAHVNLNKSERSDLAGLAAKIL